MRFKIMGIFMFLTMLIFATPCHAQGFDKQLDGRAVNVIECVKSIDIFAHVNISGELADSNIKGHKDTYSEAFIKGVKSVWEGSYNGRDIFVHIYNVPDDYTGNCVNVIIDDVDDSEDFSRALKSDNKIWLYSGDGRMGIEYRYTYNRFMTVSGHEFGHILGLGDAYSDRNEYVQKYLLTPLGAWNCFHAQDVDYYLLLKYQTWKSNTSYKYSDDELVVSLLMGRITQ